VRGFAALHLGRPNEARVIASQVAGSATDGYVPQLFLARMAQADGKYAEALRWIAQAAAEQHDALAGELIPFLPAGEVLGFLELRQGASAAAIAAFTQTLASYPNDPRALYGLALALGASGETAAAAQARARFETLWKGADTPLAGADFP
jgi:tetratricopeptide (TPR) repeat protein